METTRVRLAESDRVLDLIPCDSTLEPTTYTTFTIDNVTLSVNINTPAVNDAPAIDTNTLSPNTIDIVNDCGITVNTNNAPTIDIGTLSTDAMDTVYDSDLTLDTAFPTVDVHNI
ncbi:hypothetical protein M9H77_31019 [Catharanthus roseus]|uniref:Uncharacterized protein n=1 Tax=Catharanthus roseus TaxID=4058 RepID=A0ACB9ZYW5_CATRO|nr:hypothetical protein M9H77_31019 [Catharanthus roseus]